MATDDFPIVPLIVSPLQAIITDLPAVVTLFPIEMEFSDKS